jgi:hypothetical protein
MSWAPEIALHAAMAATAGESETTTVSLVARMRYAPPDLERKSLR